MTSWDVGNKARPLTSEITNDLMTGSCIWGEATDIMSYTCSLCAPSYTVVPSPNWANIPGRLKLVKFSILLWNTGQAFKNIGKNVQCFILFKMKQKY